jgi:tetrahydromethanopterin:alpha-L-glutamate ligase
MPRSRNTLAVEPSDGAPIVALVVDEIDRHAHALTKAFAAQGVRAIPVSLQSCGIETTSMSGLDIAGLGERLPDAVLVRSMSGGTFQAVTLRLGILHALRENGVLVWNDARAIERCVDKSTTTFFLQRAGIPTPWTWTGANRDEACAVAETKLAEGHRLVQKPLFGAQGEGLRLIESPDDLAPPEEVNGVYYLQEFIPPADDAYRDWRIFVSAGRVVAAMIRHGSSWITNIKQGARAESAIPSQVLADLALRAVASVGADYAGVDIIQDRDGAPLVLEVNSMPAWQGLQRVTRTRIADSIVAPFLDACLGPTEASLPRGQEGA